MKVAEYIISFLEAQGLDRIYEVIGGMTTLLIDAAFRNESMHIVSMHHEQAAAIAAEAYGRLTGKPGIVMATSGPGATNLITGIGSCFFDSVPAIFITGQVNTTEQKRDLKVRQFGFQETDIVSIVKPITKAAWSVKSEVEIPEILKHAYEIAISGRPGPVLIDIPMDIQKKEIDAKVPVPDQDQLSFEDYSIKDLIDLLVNAEKPIILVGGGLAISHSRDLFRDFITKIKVPVVNSLMAVDALPYKNPYRVGMIGTYGNRWANKALAKADVVLVLGSRLDIRQTGADVVSFSINKQILQVDIDAYEMNHRVKVKAAINDRVNSFLVKGIDYIGEFGLRKQHPEWLNQINMWHQEWPDDKENDLGFGINPNTCLKELSAYSKQAEVIVTDVGNHQMWAAQSMRLEENQFYLTSGGMGSMGFALPSAIGASFTCSRSPVLAVIGDGGMQMNIQELETVKYHNLPIKMVIMNNRALGMVRQFQESYFDSRFQSTVVGYSAPDFEKVSLAYGIKAFTICEPNELLEGFNRLWEKPNEPFLLQVMLPQSINVYPKIAFGRPMDEMEPLFSPTKKLE